MMGHNNILIVDDEASLRITLTRILQGIGCSVTSASDGAEAIRLLLANTFDLVFLDLRLPDMHGIDILKELRKIQPELPVIVLTAYGSMNTAVDAMHLEATDYLIKPIEPEVLIARTKSILDTLRISKRRKEIQDQISILQAELIALEHTHDETSPTLTTQPNIDSRFLKLGQFTLDLQTRRAVQGSKQLDLPPATFDYFLALARHAPDVVKYQNLVIEAQGYQTNFNEARELAKWHIHIIRQAIEGDPKSPRFLLNVRGIGYQLVVD